MTNRTREKNTKIITRTCSYYKNLSNNKYLQLKKEVNKSLLGTKLGALSFTKKTGKDIQNSVNKKIIRKANYKHYAHL